MCVCERERISMRFRLISVRWDKCGIIHMHVVLLLYYHTLGLAVSQAMQASIMTSLSQI